MPLKKIDTFNSHIKNNKIISCACVKCGKKFAFDIPESNIIKYFDGEAVQNAFPSLDPWQRELFVSGYCNECYDKLFSEEEMEEETW
jgi:hypothetical protein